MPSHISIPIHIKVAGLDIRFFLFFVFAQTISVHGPTASLGTAFYPIHLGDSTNVFAGTVSMTSY
jgi:hypothetical protein